MPIARINFIEISFTQILLFRLDIAVASKNAFNEVNRAMDLYYKVLKEVPWSTLKQKLDHLEAYRNDYSGAAAAIIAQIRVQMTNGIDAYKRSSQSISEWCGYAVKQLEAYIKLFDGVNSGNLQKQKQILVDMLNEGLQKMQAAQDELNKSSSR